ncbi:MAG: hypothetical protein WBE61_06540 [Nitrososphaeraceae archaeon]
MNFLRVISNKKKNACISREIWVRPKYESVVAIYIGYEQEETVGNFEYVIGYCGVNFGDYMDYKFIATLILVILGSLLVSPRIPSAFTSLILSMTEFQLQ